ncbi:MAG: nuclear transport factor 2 family protein [Mycobacteriaceae bacterium]
MSTSEIATVLAWHDALNAHDIDTLLSLSSDDVELATADGASQGVAALREWAEKFDTTLLPGRMFVHHGVVVVQQQLGDTWIATSFRVVQGQAVASMFRHSDLEEALRTTGLTTDDEVAAGS